MTKFALFLFVFIIPVLGLSQSARKINKALKSDYAVQLQVYDSLIQVNDSVTTVLELLQVKLNNSYTALDNQRTTLNRLKNNTINVYRYLRALDKTISFDFSYDSLQSIRNSYRIKSNTLLNKVNKRIPRQAYFVLLNDLSIKDQNVTLDSVNRATKIQIALIRQSNFEKVELINKTLIVLHDLDLIGKSFDLLHELLIKKLTYLEDKKAVYLENKKTVLLNDRVAKRKKNVRGSISFVEPIVRDDLGDNLIEYYPIPFYMQEDSGDFDFWIIEEKVYTEEPSNFVKENDQTIYTYVDEPATFSGGGVSLKRYLDANLKIPLLNIEKGISLYCYLQFIVSASGNISNVKITRGVPGCPECDKEAVRVVKGMPNWIPAKNGGKPVNSLFNLPVSFKLQ